MDRLSIPTRRLGPEKAEGRRQKTESKRETANRLPFSRIVVCLLLTAYCLLLTASCLLVPNPYELFINSLAHSYTGKRRSVCMRKIAKQKRLRKFEETTGICCFIAGLVAPIVGGLLTMVEWIVETTDHRWLHVASTGLFVIGIPLILFAGFCLDWAEREQKMSPQAVSTPNKRTLQIRTG